MRTLALPIVFAASLPLAALPPADLPPETLLLGRIRTHMAENLRHQPNYTCLETIERTQRVGAARRVQLRDTLRLEVAVVEGSEIFAWPGSKKFEETDLRKLITTGAYSNGNFALHARSVFMSNAPTFDHASETQLDGRTTVRYDFVVPRLLSGFTIRFGERSAVVGYHGSFWADPESLDVQRLEVVPDGIPLELELKEASDRMDYGRVRIGDTEFLLPEASELSMTDVRGHESRNHVRFTSCRQYTGESLLKFDDIENESLPPSSPSPVTETELPAGLDFELGLMTELNVETLAAGDPVTARLHGDIKGKGEHKNQVFAPKGAIAYGRVTRVERYPEYVIVGVTFSELEAPGFKVRFQARMLNFTGLQLQTPKTRLINRPIPQPGEGLIVVQAGRVRLFRGMLMYWGT